MDALGEQRWSTTDGDHLVARALEGDRAAQRSLFEQHQVEVYNYLRRRLRDDEAAADAAQTTFVRAFQHLGSLRSTRSFRSWLFQIACNLVRDRAAIPPVQPLDEAADAPDPAADPAARVAQAELAAVVDRAVATLTEPHQEVVVLHHLQGLEVSEVAAALGLAEGTVKSRLARAREILRRRLAPYVEG